jgi:hypothetical protein
MICEKKISWNWIVFTNLTYIFPSRFIVVCTCNLLNKYHGIGIKKY